MRIIRENLIRDRIDILPRLILRNVQLNQVRAFQRRSVDGIRSALFDPGEDVGEVKDCSRGCADGMLVWLEGKGAEVEGEASKGGLAVAFARFSDARAGTS